MCLWYATGTLEGWRAGKQLIHRHLCHKSAAGWYNKVHMTCTLLNPYHLLASCTSWPFSFLFHHCGVHDMQFAKRSFHWSFVLGFAGSILLRAMGSWWVRPHMMTRSSLNATTPMRSQAVQAAPAAARPWRYPSLTLWRRCGARHVLYCLFWVTAAHVSHTQACHTKRAGHMRRSRGSNTCFQRRCLLWDLHKRKQDGSVETIRCMECPEQQNHPRLGHLKGISLHCTHCIAGGAGLSGRAGRPCDIPCQHIHLSAHLLPPRSHRQAALQRLCGESTSVTCVQVHPKQTSYLCALEEALDACMCRYALAFSVVHAGHSHCTWDVHWNVSTSRSENDMPASVNDADSKRPIARWLTHLPAAPNQALADLLKVTHRGYFIPPRPEKNPVEGQRAQQDFVEQRRAALQHYLEQLAAHPALSRSEVRQLQAKSLLQGWVCLADDISSHHFPLKMCAGKGT